MSIPARTPDASLGALVTTHPTNPAQKSTYTINAKSGLGLRVVGGKKIPEVVRRMRKNLNRCQRDESERGREDDDQQKKREILGEPEKCR